MSLRLRFIYHMKSNTMIKNILKNHIINICFFMEEKNLNQTSLHNYIFINSCRDILFFI